MPAYPIPQNTTSRPLTFMMVSSTDHITGLTGATVVVTISKNGGAFAAPAGAVSEVGNGVYKVAGNATDSNTLGPLWLHATAAGADPSDTLYEVVGFDDQDGAAMGLTNLTNVATVSDLLTTSLGTYTGGTVGAQLKSVGGAVTSVTGAVGSVTGNVGGNVVGSVGSVTGAVTLPTIPSAWTTAVATAILVTPANKIATASGGGVQLDLTFPVPTTNTNETVGDALNAARASGFGGEIYTVTGATTGTLAMKAANGTTTVHTHNLTLNSNGDPVARA